MLNKATIIRGLTVYVPIRIRPLGKGMAINKPATPASGGSTFTLTTILSRCATRFPSVSS
jgi:hypothetical protein